MKPRVAIFEDDATHQRAYKNILENEFDVLLLDNPSAAQEDGWWTDFRPDLIVVDCQLEPDGDCFAGVDVVRHMNHRFPGVPLIVCSQFLAQGIGGKSLHSIYDQLPGVTRILSKAPFPSRQDILEIFSLGRG